MLNDETKISYIYILKLPIMILRLLVVLSLIFCSAGAKGQIITTIAGIDTAGYTGDNAAATAAALNHPDVIKFDHSGNMYIADEHNHVVRKINTSGIITTIVGTGLGAGTFSGGYSGDGGPATNAQLSRPLDLAFDAIGNLYISELGNGTIRKVNTSGIITTIAGTGHSGYNGDGGPATNAQLYDPLGLVFDNSGNLYFSDNGNARVRKINTLGIITTIVGTGILGYSGDGGPASIAQIKYGGHIAIKNSGDIFIPDYYNYRIRKVDTHGIITTIVGDGVGSNLGDGGPATAASLLNVWAILFDHSGNMILSDRLAGVIRKVNSDGIINRIGGDGILGYSGDGGPATSAKLNWDVGCSSIDAAGNLYIADPNNNRIRKITYTNTGVNNVAITPQEVLIYPNPGQNTITITTSHTLEQIIITNSTGQIVFSQEYCNVEQAKIDVSCFSKGIYFIKVNNAQIQKFEKE